MNELQTLEWYLSAGVDEIIGEEPINRLVPPVVPVQQNRPVQSNVILQAPVALKKEVNETTSALAEQATTLDELKELLQNLDTPLKKMAQRLVFADGNPHSDLMIIGEAPGGEEDRQGLPFVGPSGKLLDLMLKSIGRDRTNTYITNVVNYRPENNRTPSFDEICLFLPFLKKHIELVKPKVILLLGSCAITALTDGSETITRLRGKWMDYNGIPMLASFHPSFLLRTPIQKKNAWYDFLMIKQKL